ncbi:MAG: sigma-70 family RNA polymerase sigma factor [Planctomycetes bacterium]|nr:sigma-70 family RNA polymerase sigma factor [Planctomycetota bacterium]
MRILLDTHAPRVKWLLRSEFHDVFRNEDIEDALAEGCQLAWRSIGSFDPRRAPLRAWFFVICRNAARKMLRSRRRSPAGAQVDDWDGVTRAEPGSDGRDPLEEGDGAGQRSGWLTALYECIERLGRLMRAIVEADLRSPTGTAPADDLVAELRSSRGSVYTARSKARLRLRDCMTAKGHDFGGPPDRAGRGSPGDEDPSESAEGGRR